MVLSSLLMLPAPKHLRIWLFARVPLVVMGGCLAQSYRLCGDINLNFKKTKNNSDVNSNRVKILYTEYGGN